MPDFSLAAQPNFAQAALSGYQAGASQAKQNQLDSALGGIDLERPETLLPVLRADPSTGAALIGASTKLAAEKRDQQSKAAIAAYVKQIAPSTSGGTSSAPPATADAPTTNPDGTPADIIVTAQRDPNAVRNAAIDADPSAFLEMQSKIATMGKEQRTALDDASSAFGSVGQSALALPYAQRRGFLQAQAGYLAQHGVPAAQIAAFDPTDENLHTEIGKAVGVKGMLDQADKDRTFAQTQHHQGVEEAQGASRIGLEGQSVAIAGGHLALARNADARAATAAAAKPPAAAAAGHYVYRMVNGVTQKRLVK